MATAQAQIEASNEQASAMAAGNFTEATQALEKRIALAEKVSAARVADAEAKAARELGRARRETETLRAEHAAVLAQALEDARDVDATTARIPAHLRAPHLGDGHDAVGHRREIDRRTHGNGKHALHPRGSVARAKGQC